MEFGYSVFGGDLPGLFWTGGDTFFNVLEMFFGVVFTLEVVLRLYASRPRWRCF